MTGRKPDAEPEMAPRAAPEIMPDATPEITPPGVPGDTPSGRSIRWGRWLAVNAAIGVYLTYAFVAPASPVKRALLPGKTTHGHYQIEMACDQCHAAADNQADHSSGDVLQDACVRCHQDSLSKYDTHPAKKFRDPTNAALLQILDAQSCLACHQEHVPERTSAAGLTVPTDYCWHCHDDVGEHRQSHVGMSFDSCSTAGCHNYHDNRAIYEKFLDKHYGEPDHFDVAVLPMRDFGDRWQTNHDAEPLTVAQADAPSSAMRDETILQGWATTAHAAAGVQCTECHRGGASDDTDGDWSNTVSMDQCQTCHDPQVESFVRGKHGMRLAAGLTPMQPSMARLPMHAGAAHAELTCNACHAGHRYDTAYAAAEACLKCHADSHSVAYVDSAHADLWLAEQSGDGSAGSGVSCASCHMPRLETDDGIVVQHNQSEVLHPSETMARQVCGHCHGLEYSLSALADAEVVAGCFVDPPSEVQPSVEMAHEYFESRRR